MAGTGFGRHDAVMSSRSVFPREFPLAKHGHEALEGEGQTSCMDVGSLGGKLREESLPCPSPGYPACLFEAVAPTAVLGGGHLS